MTTKQEIIDFIDIHVKNTCHTVYMDNSSPMTFTFTDLQKIIVMINKLQSHTKFEDIRLYKENIVKGEVIYMGNNIAPYSTADYPYLDETEAYVIMKMKVKE